MSIALIDLPSRVELQIHDPIATTYLFQVFHIFVQLDLFLFELLEVSTASEGITFEKD